jgi:hypothetical protein
VTLADSFPQGLVPANAVLEKQVQQQRGGRLPTWTTPDELKRVQRRSLRWIAYAALTVTLVLAGALGPLDMGGLLVWNFYSYLLIQLATKATNGLPSRPADGHVPAALLRNPLREVSSSHNSKSKSNNGRNSPIHWDAWINFVVPALVWTFTLLVDPLTLTTTWWRVALGRPLVWWMTMQVADDVLHEDECRIPLPIQYWIRLSSRVIRWVFLTLAVVLTYWPTATSTHFFDGGASHVALAAIPLLHWLWSSVQIFGYWIPRASLAYLRAHWVATEAATLTLQSTAVHHYSIPGLTTDTASPEGKPS